MHWVIPFLFFLSYWTVDSGADTVTMDVQNQEVVRLTPPEVINHGFMRVLTRPAQWLIIIVLLISWSAAGIFMFDFVSDDQITSKRLLFLYLTTSLTSIYVRWSQCFKIVIKRKSGVNICFIIFFKGLQHISTDPMTAVNEAVEGFTDKMSHLNDIINNAHGKFNHFRCTVLCKSPYFIFNMSFVINIYLINSALLSRCKSILEF